MIFCIFDIRNFKIKDKKQENACNDVEVSKKCLKTSFFRSFKNCIVFNYDRLCFLLKIKLNCNPVKINTVDAEKTSNKMSGYYYDYKYGAGGFYLKAGLACKFYFNNN